MKKSRVSIYVLFVLLFSTCGKEEATGFFLNMPDQFCVDSLEVQKDLFDDITISHIGKNSIQIEASYTDLLPFVGILLAKNDTVFFQNPVEEEWRPFLLFNAAKFDTLTVNYSSSRSDNIIAMGKMFDSIFSDSIPYFQLIPMKRVAPTGSTYVKYIAIKDGFGIRYLTFSNYSDDYTIILQDHPRVVWTSSHSETP